MTIDNHWPIVSLHRHHSSSETMEGGVKTLQPDMISAKKRNTEMIIHNKKLRCHSGFQANKGITATILYRTARHTLIFAERFFHKFWCQLLIPQEILIQNNTCSPHFLVVCYANIRTLSKFRANIQIC